ncbi:hypothetical protein AAG906_005540 [Vitis piasezkii]
MAIDGGNAIPLSDVMKAATWPNIINFIHSNISKNSLIGESIESVDKTSTTINILKQVGACPDAEKAKDNYGIPAGPLIGVVLGIVFVKIFHPSSISMVGKIPQGLPKFSVPKSFGICLDL